MTMTSAAPGAANALAGRFAHTRYIVRRQVFKLFGAAFHVYDEQGNLLLYSKQKAFKLKEDIRLYTDESMSIELLSITARQIIDFSAAYDVIDPINRVKVGALKRKGWSSILRDAWIIMDGYDREIATITEDSQLAALARRFIDFAALIFPQKFHAEIQGQTVCTFQQNFNPFVRKLTVDYSGDTQGWLDRRLGIAAAVLISAIEGKQG
jgi:hypothetical protein